MKKTMSIVFGSMMTFAVTANQDKIDSNMMWDDNKDFHLTQRYGDVKIKQIHSKTANQDKIDSNMMWEDNEDFHLTQRYGDVKIKQIHSNMMWGSQREYELVDYVADHR